MALAGFGWACVWKRRALGCNLRARVATCRVAISGLEWPPVANFEIHPFSNRAQTG